MLGLATVVRLGITGIKVVVAEFYIVILAQLHRRSMPGRKTAEAVPVRSHLPYSLSQSKADYRRNPLFPAGSGMYVGEPGAKTKFKPGGVKEPTHGLMLRSTRLINNNSVYF